MMTTVNEVNNDKTKLLNEFIFRSVPLVRSTAELDILKLWLHTGGGVEILLIL